MRGHETAKHTLAAAAAGGHGLLGVPPLDAVVLAVRPEADLVILSLGHNDGVEEGHEFTVYRNKNFIAKVKVIRTTDDLAGARILYQEGKASVQQNDKATTRLGA